MLLDTAHLEPYSLYTVSIFLNFNPGMQGAWLLRPVPLADKDSA